MTFKDWTAYFKRNANHYQHFHWDEDDIITPTEKTAITASIQKFQRGENSEGKHLFKHAQSWDNDDYLETITLFIKEEQQHAKILAKLMDRHDIPKLKQGDWVDGAFRWMRNLAGLELSITVLVTAELVAAVYYQALRDATGSSNLKRICERILQDEETHINFQAFALRHFHAKRYWLFNKMVNYMHWTLLLGTSILVWLYHYQMFNAGGFSFSSYQKSLWGEYFRMENMISGSEAIEIRKLLWAVV